jgi:hypothetical protein
MGLADVPPLPRLNSCSVMGEAASSVFPVTVSMTRSPAVKEAIEPAAAGVAAPSAAKARSVRLNGEAARDMCGAPGLRRRAAAREVKSLTTR